MPPLVISSVHLPCALIVEKSICALLKVFSDVLRFLMSLKPSLILLMESPTLIFQSLGCHVLLGSTLLIVEYIEQSVRVHTGVQPRVIEDSEWLAGKS